MDLKPSEGELISLQVTSQTHTKEALDHSMETEELEQWERGSRMDPPVDQFVQTEIMLQTAQIDPIPDLTDFLKRTMPRIMRALEPRQSQIPCIPYLDPSASWDDESEVTETMRLYAAPSREETIAGEGRKEDYFEAGERLVAIKLGVSCVKWNCRGTIVAAGYLLPGRHGGWCSHKGLVWAWNSAGKEEKPQSFETDGCITAIGFHPTSPLGLVAGSFNGQLMLLDLGRPDPLVNTTPVDEYFHREAISQITWIDSPSGPQLFSVSADSKVLQWDAHLRFPLRGFLITAGEGGLSLASPLDDYGTVLIGTESGAVLKGTIGQVLTEKTPIDSGKWKPDAELILNNVKSRHEIKTQTERYAVDTGKRDIDPACIYSAKPELKRLYGSPFSFPYERHDGPVIAVAANPFHRHLFATGSTDGTVHIYHLLSSRSISVLEPADRCPIGALFWSLSRPLVLFIGTGDGNVYVYDLGLSVGKWVQKIEGESRDMVVSLAGNKGNRGVIAVGYAGGEVRIVKLSRHLTQLQPDDLRKLSTFLSLT